METITDLPPPPAMRQNDAFGNLIDRKTLAAAFPGGGRCERTIIRWENEYPDPLPVLKIGKLRLYEMGAVRAWILRRQQKQHEEPKIGRPTKRRAA